MKTIILKNKNLELEEKDMFKKDFIKLFSLNMRDLRPVFSTLQVATVLPRKNSVILNLGFIKAIFSNSEIYFLKQFKSNRFDSFLNKMIKKANENKINNFFLFVFENILENKIIQMNEKTTNLRKWVDTSLSSMQNDLTEQNLKNLLSIKKRISKLDIRLKEIHSAVEEILEDDDDLKKLITIANPEQKDSFEMESILENFLEQLEDEIGKLNQIDEEIENTEEFIDLTLSTKRTKIVKIDLIATIFTLTLTVLSVVVGLYGVNLYNGFENSKFAFKILSISLIAFVIISNITIFWIIKKNKIF